MSVYEIDYQDEQGRHAEAVDANDDVDAVQAFRVSHSGQHVEVLDVRCAGDCDLVYQEG